jgi:trans-aconitate methyltransferase
MTTPKISTPEFFEAKYKKQADPWNFVKSDYELKRYDTILAALNHRRYRSAFEPGCSIGVLTERLATLSDKVVAIDFSPSAVAKALARCSHCPGVEIHCASLPAYMPGSGFDLIVLSEIGYYFSPEEWEVLSSRIVSAMDQGATLLAAHWLGHSKDHRMGGDAVHEILNNNAQLVREHAARHEGFRIDRWIRT